MQTVTLYEDSVVHGMTVAQRDEMIRDFPTYDDVRRIERWSIREFMRECASLLKGTVLDYGCGLQPYRGLVDGRYVGYDPYMMFAEGNPDDAPVKITEASFDVIMCNQVVQYLHDPELTLRRLFALLKPGGRLVMTYPTNWCECEDSDLFRFTQQGMTYLLHRIGFDVDHHTLRAQVAHKNFRFPLGYGVVAYKKLNALRVLVNQ